MEERFMKQAIAQALQGQGQTYTNPLVGAVIVKDQQVLAKGAHLAFGKEHAEKMALNQIHDTSKLIGATLYVTLEPCNHTGKQPPCTQAIIENGITTVFVGQVDPNPLVSGQGIRALRAQGITVVTGVLNSQVRALNPFYNYFYENRRPYVVLKQAITLDGKLAKNKETASQITGKETWQYVHSERANYQAILVGSQTVLTDNPHLKTSPTTPYPPIRVVLDRRGRTFSTPTWHLFTEAFSPVWLFTEKAAPSSLPPHVRVFVQKRWPLAEVVATLAKAGVQSIYVEGGGTVHDAFLAANLWNECITYIAPEIFGGHSIPAFGSKRTVHQGVTLTQVEVDRLGADIRISGRNATCLPD